MKKFFSILLSMLLAAGCACADTQEPYTVGICQYAQHEALDLATEGFMQALSAALGADRIQFDVQNASGDSSTCSAIVNDFITNEVDLILANATTALQIAAASTADLPVLGTSITEYGVALDIENFNGLVGGNISGTSDLAPLDQQAQMIPTLFPEAKTVGILFCSAEPNSQYQVKTVKAYLEELGLTANLYPFADSNDLFAVVQTACEACDVLYTPTDNTVAANAGIVDNICRPAGIPVITGDTGTCRLAGVAVLGISYYELGQVTGRIAAQVLTGEKSISEMPIAYVDAVKHHYNPEICEELGVVIPEGYTVLPEE